jgi:glycosyltransferase involved in cell wall biosynthesis
MKLHPYVKKVVLDARLDSGLNPGIQTLIEGFIEGINEVPTKGFELYWLTTEDNSWLLKKIKDKQRVIIDDVRHLYEIPPGKTQFFQQRASHQMSILNEIDHRLPRAPKSLDAIKPNLVQFFSQDAFVTKYRSIYHPHDLQHLHFPENFSSAQLEWRGMAWPSFSKLASMIVVGSDHVATDLEEYWKIPKEMIFKIDLRTHVPEEGIQLNSKRAFNCHKVIVEDYIIYPAAYYPHKNHLNLLYAVDFLRKQGFDFKVVLTGGAIAPENDISRLIRRLNLHNQVIELGYVERQCLIDLIKASKMVVVPSMYESRSFPVEEGIALHVPVVASDILGIREQFEKSEFLFNPTDPKDIAKKIQRILEMSDLEKQALTDKNFRSASKRDWSDVAFDYLKLWKRV